MKQAYFITATDTDAGKTYIASALVNHFAQLGLKSVGMKPIAAGCEWVDGVLQNSDVLQLRQASNVDAPLSLINPYAFQPPIAPHIAAQRVGAEIVLEKIQQAFTQLSQRADVVIVEGAGGFLVPLNDTQTMADLAANLNIPVILVVGMRLGCINHALLSVQAIQARGLTLAGWVANQIDPNMAMLTENIQTLKQRIHVPCLAEVAWGQTPQFTGV
ncbi:MAG TPA: dethiobiotin synthase [Methylophilaceae bacterium]|jgi:dethiobiotin synthetase